MARVITYENICDNCGTPVGRVNDKDSLDMSDPVKDNNLPPWWAELTITIKQPNPTRVALDAIDIQAQQEADKRLPGVLKKSAVEKAKEMGLQPADPRAKLTDEEREALRGMVVQQVREAALAHSDLADIDPEDEPPLAMVDGSDDGDDPDIDGQKRFILCTDCVPFLTKIGVNVFETHVLEGNTPPWPVLDAPPTTKPAATNVAGPGDGDDGDEGEPDDDDEDEESGDEEAVPSAGATP